MRKNESKRFNNKKIGGKYIYHKTTQLAMKAIIYNKSIRVVQYISLCYRSICIILGKIYI